MEKRNYIKPNVVCNNLHTEAFIAGSAGFQTTNTTTAVNLIESCFHVEQKIYTGATSNNEGRGPGQGNNNSYDTSGTITDSYIEDWLEMGNSVILTADNKGEGSYPTDTCSKYFNSNSNYKITYNGVWTFSPTSGSSTTTLYYKGLTINGIVQP